jgi:hypothetical protein
VCINRIVYNNEDVNTLKCALNRNNVKGGEIILYSVKSSTVDAIQVHRNAVSA